jgi:hypothetical protein
MNAIAFQSVLQDNVIKVPDQYRFDTQIPVLVTITVLSDSRPLIIPRRKSGRVTEDNFTALQIDTKNFKFDREEANER